MSPNKARHKVRFISAKNFLLRAWHYVSLCRYNLFVFCLHPHVQGAFLSALCQVSSGEWERPFLNVECVKLVDGCEELDKSFEGFLEELDKNLVPKFLNVTIIIWGTLPMVLAIKSASFGLRLKQNIEEEIFISYDYINLQGYFCLFILR